MQTPGRPSAGDSASAFYASMDCAQEFTALSEPEWSSAPTCFVVHLVSLPEAQEYADLRDH